MNRPNIRIVLALLLVMVLFAEVLAACSPRDGYESSSEPEEPSQSSAAVAYTPPEPSSEPEEPEDDEEEDQGTAEQSAVEQRLQETSETSETSELEEPMVPDGPEVNEEARLDRELVIPANDPFTLVDVLAASGVSGVGDLTAVYFTRTDPGGSHSLTVTTQEDIARVWDIMGQTPLTALGDADINPATGGSLSLSFAIGEEPTDVVTMVGIVWVGNGVGPYVFVNERHENVYGSLYRALGGQ